MGRIGPRCAGGSAPGGRRTGFTRTTASGARRGRGARLLIEVDMFGNKLDKVADAIKFLQDVEPPEGFYVAFSGGKDSIVMYDLVKRSGVKYDAHYQITGIDPPELYYFIRDNYPEVQRHRPEKTIWKLIVNNGIPPTQIMRYCCKSLKECGGVGRCVVTGIRWAESARRKKRERIEMCFKGKTKIYVHPIIGWSDNDVWDYIRGNNLPYCRLYDEGFKRLGCIGCPMARKSVRVKQFLRWPRYERLWRKACLKAAQKTLSRWKDGESMFNWWMSGVKRKDSDQTVMFE